MRVDIQLINKTFAGQITISYMAGNPSELRGSVRARAGSKGEENPGGMQPRDEIKTKRTGGSFGEKGSVPPSKKYWGRKFQR